MTWLLSVNVSAALATLKPATYLDRLILEVINLRSRIECFHKCVQLNDCVSANFYKGSPPLNNICTLNGATRKDQYVITASHGEIYYGVDVAEWIYMELVEK